MTDLRRREFITLLGSSVVASPRGARAAYKGVSSWCAAPRQCRRRRVSAQRWIAQVHSGREAADYSCLELVRCSSAMQTPTRSPQRWIAQVHSGREAADYSLPRSIGG